MENTVNNKMAFFAQYWGQKVLHIRNSPIPFHLSSMKPSDILESDYLSLKALSSISDEDAIEVAKILTPEIETFGRVHEFKEDILEIFLGQIGFDDLSGEFLIGGLFSAYDHLRSKSYLLPFMGLSVETLVEYGWVRLTN